MIMKFGKYVLYILGIYFVLFIPIIFFQYRGPSGPLYISVINLSNRSYVLVTIDNEIIFEPGFGSAKKGFFIEANSEQSFHLWENSESMPYAIVGAYLIPNLQQEHQDSDIKSAIFALRTYRKFLSWSDKDNPLTITIKKDKKIIVEWPETIPEMVVR